LSFRWHGRGGYGAKTAAILLAEAIIDAGGYAQAAPEFGPERLRSSKGGILFVIRKQMSRGLYVL